MMFHFVETFAMFIVSLLGFLINAFLFYKFSSLRGSLSSFQKLCFAKALSNALISASVLFWAVPLSAVSLKTEHVWRPLNIGISQLTASGGYIFGPLCQICMAANRVLILFFPFLRMKWERVPSTNIAIFVCVLVSLYFGISGMKGSCVLVYHPETLAWSPELTSCFDSMDGWMLPTISILTIISILLNLLAALKMIYEKVAGISESRKTQRRNKWVAMFTQNVIQDILHVVDMINYTLICKISEAEWFQFIFMSLSFSMIYALDGLVMLHFHVYTHQKTVRRKMRMCIVAANMVSPPRIHVSPR